MRFLVENIIFDKCCTVANAYSLFKKTLSDEDMESLCSVPNVIESLKNSGKYSCQKMIHDEPHMEFYKWSPRDPEGAKRLKYDIPYFSWQVNSYSLNGRAEEIYQLLCERNDLKFCQSSRSLFIDFWITDERRHLINRLSERMPEPIEIDAYLRLNDLTIEDLKRNAKKEPSFWMYPIDSVQKYIMNEAFRIPDSFQKDTYYQECEKIFINEFLTINNVHYYKDEIEQKLKPIYNYMFQNILPEQSEIQDYVNKISTYSDTEDQR